MLAAVENANAILAKPSTASYGLEQQAACLSKLDKIIIYLEETASGETENSLGNGCSVWLEAELKSVVNDA